MVTAVDDLRLRGYAWLPDEGVPTRAVVVISHGMAEYVERYARFATALTAAGYAVYGCDHRGHGRTATENDQPLGHFADAGGWGLVQSDLDAVRREAERRHPGLPVFLFAHSMGSLIARAYVQQHGEDLAGLVLSGTGTDPGPVRYGGLAIAAGQARLKGRRDPSAIMDKLSFGAFNKPFEVGGKSRTGFEWLSRDEAEVDKYVAHPWCGHLCTAQFWVDLLGGVAGINDPKKVALIPKRLPILLMSGSADPVGDQWKGVLKVKQQLQDAGIADVRSQLYRDARHEILNETCRDQVTADVLAWLDEHVTTRA